MPPPNDDVAEQELPGIGRRYDMRDENGRAVSVIVHHSGRRDVYAEGRDPEALDLLLSFTDDQARRFGAILGGAYFTPAVVRRIEAVIGGLLIDWVTLRPSSPAVGRSIADMEIRRRTRMTVAAILRDDVPLIAPDPSEVMATGDRLVVMGRRGELSLILATLAVGAGLDPRIAPFVALYVLVLAIGGPLLAARARWLATLIPARLLPARATPAVPSGASRR